MQKSIRAELCLRIALISMSATAKCCCPGAVTWHLLDSSKPDACRVTVNLAVRNDSRDGRGRHVYAGVATLCWLPPCTWPSQDNQCCITEPDVQMEAWCFESCSRGWSLSCGNFTRRNYVKTANSSVHLCSVTVQKRGSESGTMVQAMVIQGTLSACEASLHPCHGQPTCQSPKQLRNVVLAPPPQQHLLRADCRRFKMDGHLTQRCFPSATGSFQSEPL